MQKHPMKQKLVLAAIGLVIWVILGMILSLSGALISGYSLIRDSLIYGMFFGALIGTLLALIELVAASALTSTRVMLWMIGGSVMGALVGFWGLVIWGGYPTRTQADLVFVGLALPVTLVGALLGCAIALGLWRSRSR